MKNSAALFFLPAMLGTVVFAQNNAPDCAGITQLAPERISAKAGSATPWPDRTRPLCAFPQWPHYKGMGSMEDEANFTCR